MSTPDINVIFPDADLPHVIVPFPLYITVHLGAPDEEALNVTIPYLDYIKNVASSELYPTWPEEALRANIYAITSFAMNRIFTEWYRSRGYDFDILRLDATISKKEDKLDAYKFAEKYESIGNTLAKKIPIDKFVKM